MAQEALKKNSETLQNVAVSTNQAANDGDRLSAARTIPQILANLDPTKRVLSPRLATNDKVPPLPQNTLASALSKMSDREVARELNVQSKLLQTMEQISQLETSLKRFPVFVDQAQPLLQQLKARNLLYPPAALSNLLANTNKRINEIIQSSPPAQLKNEISPEFAKLTADRVILIKALDFINLNDIHTRGFDDAIKLMKLYQERDQLKQETTSPEPATAESVGELSKSMEARRNAISLKLQTPDLNITGLIARTARLLEFNPASLENFDQESQKLLAQLDQIDPESLVERTQQLRTSIKTARAKLVEAIKNYVPDLATKVADRADTLVDIPLPSAARATLPNVNSVATTPQPQIVPDLTDQVESDDTPTQTNIPTVSPNRVDNKTSQQRAIPNPYAQRKRAAASPINRAPTVQVQAKPLDQATQPNIPLPDVNKTVPPTTNTVTNLPKTTLNDTPPAPRSLLPQVDTDTKDTLVANSNLRDTLPPISNQPERIVDLGAMRKVMQANAESVIAEYPKRPVPAAVMQEWEDAAQAYLERQGRGNDRQLVLSMLTLFDSHNRKYGGRVRSLLNWAGDKLKRSPKAPKSAAEQDIGQMAAAIDALIANYPGLNDNEKVLLRENVLRQYETSGEINPENVADEINKLLENRAKIHASLNQIADVEDDTATVDYNEAIDNINSSSSLSEAINAVIKVSPDDQLIKSLLREAQTFESTRNFMRGTPEYRALMDKIKRAFPDNQRLVSALLSKLVATAVSHDARRTEEILATQVVQSPEPIVNPSDFVEANDNALLQEIAAGDPDEAIGTAIRYFKTHNDAGTVYALRDIDNKLDALFDLASANTDRIHEKTIAPLFDAINQVLASQHPDLAKALLQQTEKRLRIQNQMIEGRISREDDEDEPRTNTLDQPPRIDASKYQPNRLDDDEDAANEKMNRLSNQAINILNKTDVINWTEIVKLYQNAGEKAVADQLQALAELMPKIERNKPMQALSPLDILILGGRLANIPNISPTFRLQLQQKVGNTLVEWNVRAANPKPSSDIPQAA